MGEFPCPAAVSSDFFEKTVHGRMQLFPAGRYYRTAEKEAEM